MEQGIVKDVAILTLGIVAGLLPWLFDKVGIEMPKPIFVGFLYLAIVLVWWALLSLDWIGHFPLIRGKQVFLSSAILSATAVVAIAVLSFHFIHPTTEFPYKSKPEASKYITHQTFINETVPLDDIGYSDCTFENVTFSYDGTTPIHFTHNVIRGSIMISTNNHAVFGMGALLKGLGMENASVKLLMHKKTTENIEAPSIKQP